MIDVYPNAAIEIDVMFQKGGPDLATVRLEFGGLTLIIMYISI